MSRITDVCLPRFGKETCLPELPVAVYAFRQEAACERMARENLDMLVVYADREHAANIAYLTGFEPRFEEALFCLGRDGRRLLVVGNECMGYLPDATTTGPVALFQDFSLMGQPRGESKPLAGILGAFGVPAGALIGCVGWKHYSPHLVANHETATDMPAYIADALCALAGRKGRLVNRVALLTDPQTGLRATNEAAQIARFEYAATRTSESILAGLRSLRPGIREYEVEACFRNDGLPLSCHSMTGFGSKAAQGLASPSARQAKMGDAFTMAQGLCGSLTARAGVIAAGPAELDAPLRDFYPAFVTNYFDAVTAWYEALQIGVTGGAVFRAVDARLDRHVLHLALNPGHTIHLDEWVDSPFYKDSAQVLGSGLALQMDMIPVTEGPFCCSNVEDGVVLADEALCAELANRFPAAWGRIEARRAFMQDVLGIRLDASVLPMGNMPGYLNPFALAPDKAMVAR